MVFKNVSQAKKETGITYLGNVNHSTKHAKSIKYEEMVYSIYLSPAKMSGYEVCPMRTEECTLLCLNESGLNRMDAKHNNINNSRIKKTRLFFEERDFFVKWVIKEIQLAKSKAEKLGMSFSVRLNNTSDLNPQMFKTKIDGKWMNLFQIFPDVQFYDYTKIPNRIKLMEIYPNYDVTFSYSGENMDDCITFLENGVRVAMVFDKVPTTYMGYEVIDGDKSDLRYYEDKNVIVGLKFKKVRNVRQLNHKFVIQISEEKFVLSKQM